MSIFRNLLVVELASVLAGPSVGMFFAELGATVIKVENPATGGDVTRSWKLPAENPNSDISAYYASVNWGKSSLLADLTTADGKEQVYNLVRRADIVLASYKPGDDSKLGVDYTTLSALNPRLIYASITGYGSQEKRVGYDAVIQAETGFMAMNGTPTSGPVKMPVALMDVLTAHQLKEAVLLALLHRATTGEGSCVSVSLVQAGIASLVNQATGWLMAGAEPQRIGSDHPTIVPYGTVFATRDEQPILLAVGSNAQFHALCDVLGEPHLAADARFATNYNRVCNKEQLLPLLARAIARFSRAELLVQLHARAVPCGAVNSLADVFAQPTARELVVRSADGVQSGVRSIAFTASFLEREPLTPPPHLGEQKGML